MHLLERMITARNAERGLRKCCTINATKQYIGRIYRSYPGEMAFPLASQTSVAKKSLSLANSIFRQTKAYRRCWLLETLALHRH